MNKKLNKQALSIKFRLKIKIFEKTNCKIFNWCRQGARRICNVNSGNFKSVI